MNKAKIKVEIVAETLFMMAVIFIGSTRAATMAVWARQFIFILVLSFASLAFILDIFDELEGGSKNGEQLCG